MQEHTISVKRSAVNGELGKELAMFFVKTLPMHF